MEDISSSIIIPVRNRWEALHLTLLQLEQQSISASQFEVIVVDNNSDDMTVEKLSAPSLNLPIRVFSELQPGAARVRNRGAAQARGEILIFLDADMVVNPEFIQAHLECHQEHQHALGVGWRLPWPDARVSLFNKLIDLDSNIHPGKQTTFQEAFTANLSIRKADFAMLNGFDETFQFAEDIDFAYRAVQMGCKIIECPKAVGYHNHPIDFSRACQQAQDYAASTALLFAKHPGLRGEVDHLRDKEPVNWSADSFVLILKKTARTVLAQPLCLKSMEQLARILEKHYPSPRLLRWLYWKILGSYYWIGLNKGLHQYRRKI